MDNKDVSFYMISLGFQDKLGGYRFDCYSKNPESWDGKGGKFEKVAVILIPPETFHTIGLNIEKFNFDTMVNVEFVEEVMQNATVSVKANNGHIISFDEYIATLPSKHLSGIFSAIRKEASRDITPF